MNLDKQQLKEVLIEGPVSFSEVCIKTSPWDFDNNRKGRRGMGLLGASLSAELSGALGGMRSLGVKKEREEDHYEDWAQEEGQQVDGPSCWKWGREAGLNHF